MSYHAFIIARIVHVLAVVVWIGGVAAVTTVMFPMMHRLETKEQKVWLFQQVEARFRPQARIAWLLTGLSGIFMVNSLRAWHRFVEARYWWMHAMVGLWMVFGLMLFIVEPFFAGPRLQRDLARDPERALSRMQVLHWLLLLLSLMVIASAIGGIYGIF